ncbi:MAG: type I restriction enzyme HsdR N-terminal domain-containing protein [Ferruginibacter sp.]|nr:type I restriction enzyme HsdR N-terminal domain-containing protein [Ferruginibacter sp.]
MIKIIYPEENPKVRRKGDANEVFCSVRRRWVKLTREEWVRQNFLLYLHRVCGYPTSLTAVERQLKVGNITKRFDIVLFKADEPYLIVECKEMNAPLDMEVMMQALRYNSELRAPFLAITNGVYTYLFQQLGNTMEEAHAFPKWH